MVTEALGVAKLLYNDGGGGAIVGQ